MQRVEQELKDHVSDLKETGGKIVEVEKIGDTPFVLVKVEDGFFVGIGKYRLSDFYKDRAEAEYLVHSKDWGLMMSLMSVIFETAGNVAGAKLD